MRLSIDKIAAAFDALQLLDGYDVVVPDKDGQPRAVRCLYELGATRLLIAKNINRLLAFLQRHRIAQQRLMAVGAAGGAAPDPAQRSAIRKAKRDYDKTANVEHVLGLEPMTVEQLRMDKNQFPSLAIAILLDVGLIRSGKKS